MNIQYRRGLFPTLLKRMQEPRRFLQVLAGPRQVGKTTLARQVAKALDIPTHYASADEPTMVEAVWDLEQGYVWRPGFTRNGYSKRLSLLVVQVPNPSGIPLLSSLYPQNTDHNWLQHVVVPQQQVESIMLRSQHASFRKGHGGNVM